MPRKTAPLEFVYIEGDDRYVHPAVVRPATDTDLSHFIQCQCECDDDILVGDVILVTDPALEGEWFAHLGCALQTAGVLQAAEERYNPFHSDNF